MSTSPQMVIFGRAATAAAELASLIDRKSNINSLAALGDNPETFSGEFELQDISFSYPTRVDVTVLDKFSLRAPAGKVTALVVSPILALDVLSFPPLVVSSPSLVIGC